MDNTKDELQIKIEEARALLSKESREAIDNVNWKLTIWKMDKKYSQEQLENLETETELLLCGILNTQDYPVELEKRMKLTKEEVSLLLNEMNQLIFKKIHEELEKKIYKEGISLTSQPKPSISIQTPASILDSRFADMPENVKGAISKSKWKEKLYELAKKYQLSIEQSGMLEEITVKVMQNVIHPDHYESELASKMQTISKENISSLVNDVNNNILKVIRELMMGKEVINNEGKAPLPPYSQTINNEETPKVTEATISAMHFPTKITEPVKPIKTNFELPDIPQNIIEEKLKGATVSDHTVSDYSTPKINNPTPVVSQNNQNQAPRSADPYRETF